MSTVHETLTHYEEIERRLRTLDLVEDNGENMESDWHRLAMNLLIEQICWFLRGRKDFFCGGNMFIYFNVEQARNRDFRGPDFFFVNGVPREPLRRWWAVWDEGGRYPDVIIELTSPSTTKEDHTTKKDVYEQIFRTRDYFCYDPDTQTLEGWHLGDGHYEPLTANERGWLWCKELELWLGTWEGTFMGLQATWLRFYDRDGNVLPIFAEAERQRAEAERQRAEAERQRADAAEAELARLKARLAQLEEKQDRPGDRG
jgi:Uma2 family endonuclease